MCLCVRFFVSFSFFHNGGCSTIGGFVCVLLSLSLTLVVMVFECCVDLFFCFPQCGCVGVSLRGKVEVKVCVWLAALSDSAR